MTLTLTDSGSDRLALPPMFSLVVSRDGEGAFARACRLAAPGQAGTLVWARRDDVLDLAVVLEPEEPLGTALRAFFAGMVALAEAIGAHAPPEMPVSIAWPDTILYDGARLGGGRLGWPEDCAEDAVPDWLVFSAMLIASKATAGDPGLTPGSTSLENEGFVLDEPGVVIESFARYLTKAFESWAEDGFVAIERRYLARLTEADGRIDGNGDRIAGRDRRPLVPALRSVAWLDPRTGGPHL